VSESHVDDMAGNRVEGATSSASDTVGNRVEGATARAVLEYIAREVASDPEGVVVEADDSGRTLRLRVHVAPEDMGRMIGRRGRVAQAIRTIVRVAGSRDGTDTNVDFVDD
jgi:predicted RNA-binding protein YlqC (UPF0109 family)